MLSADNRKIKMLNNDNTVDFLSVLFYVFIHSDLIMSKNNYRHAVKKLWKDIITYGIEDWRFGFIY